MGLGLIAWGFLFLHFNFTDYRFDRVQVLPMTICIPIIILGLLYAYRDTKKKEYLNFVTIAIVLLGLTLFENVRQLYLLVLVILYVGLLLFISKQFPHYLKQKRFTKWIIFYGIFGLLRAVTTPFNIVFEAWNQAIYLLSSLMTIIAIIPLSIHLYFIKKTVTIEQHPQLTPPSIPKCIYVLVIVISIVFIGFTNSKFVGYTYEQAIGCKLYMITNDSIEPQYMMAWETSYSSVYDPIDYILIDDVQLKEGIHADNLEIKMNGYPAIRGEFQYVNENQYHFSSSTDESGPFNHLYSSHFSEFKLDGQVIPTKCEEQALQRYGYQDSHIIIKDCRITDNHVFVLPQIEILNQNIKINTIEILDQNNKVIVSDYKYEHVYRDGVSFYPESLVETLNNGEGPYYIRITYDNQENTVEEYPLKEYAHNLP